MGRTRLCQFPHSLWGPVSDNFGMWIIHHQRTMSASQQSGSDRTGHVQLVQSLGQTSWVVFHCPQFKVLQSGCLVKAESGWINPLDCRLSHLVRVRVPHCLRTSMWIKKVRLQCLPSRGPQISSQRWIWEIPWVLQMNCTFDWSTLVFKPISDVSGNAKQG